MKKIKYILNTILLILMITFSFQITMPSYAESKSSSNSQPETSNSNTLSNEDWKIVVDDKNDSNEFSFIQKNLESSNLADNGYFLLIAGIILITLSLLGIVFFSVKLYKISKGKNYKNKRHKASHY